MFPYADALLNLAWAAVCLAAFAWFLAFERRRASGSRRALRYRAIALSLALVSHVRERQLGEIWISPFDVILDATRHLVVQPDLFFISNERSHILTDKVRGAPDLVVEVLSPHPRIGSLVERLDWFARYDVRECWLIHQLQSRMEVLNFGDGRVVQRESFDRKTPIRSRVLADFNQTLESMLRWGN